MAFDGQSIKEEVLLYKNADETVNNSVVQQADDTFQLLIKSGEKWVVECNLWMSTVGGGGFQLD